MHLASSSRQERSLEVEEDRIEAAIDELGRAGGAWLESGSNSCLYRHINQEALEIVLLVPSVRI